MAQYKVKISFEAFIRATTDDQAEKKAASRLSLILDHVCESGITRLVEKSPDSEVELTVESECWNT